MNSETRCNDGLPHSTVGGAVLLPQEPVRETIGRYAPPLWSYKGEMMDYADAAIKYERDRANYWEAEATRLRLPAQPSSHESIPE